MRRILAMLLTALMVAGCGSMQTQQRASSLDETLNAYRILLRWAQYEDAMGYIRFRPGKEQEIATPDFEALKQVRLASYDIADKVLSSDENEATVRVLMTYYASDSNVLHSLRQIQTWWYNEEKKKWYLEGELPDLIGGMERRN
jgi:hypothetical protein